MYRPNENHFAMVPTVTAERSHFNLSMPHKTTFNAGYLIPVYFNEILPGDTFSVNGQFFCRLACALKTPIMDNLYLDMQAWWIPNRLVWKNWAHFCGEKDDPDDDPTDYLVPQIYTPGSTGCVTGDLMDYFGIPKGVPNLAFDVLLPRAYNLVFNTWYRHQKIQSPVQFTDEDSGDSYSDFLIRRRNKRYDYFTSALPEPQEGPGVSIPLGTTAPVYGTDKALGMIGVRQSDGTARTFGLAYDSVYGLVGDHNAFNIAEGQSISSGDHPKSYYTVGVVTKGATGSSPEASGLYTDLTTATAATINSLRLAFAMQRYAETLMRAGNRYIEQLRAIWNVEPGDYRLQRPEFLGSSSNLINCHVVAQTAPHASGTQYLGDVGAFSTGSGGLSFVKSFVEHGHILVLASVRADMTYQKGRHKMWARQTYYDFYQPPFAHLGEQPVLQGEIFAKSSETDNSIVFGYQEYGAEYRYGNPLITGMFNSEYAYALDSWHLAQDFGASVPELDTTFMAEYPPVDRVLQVASEGGTTPQFLFDSLWTVNAARRMPIYSIPGELDHH